MSRRARIGSAPTDLRRSLPLLPRRGGVSECDFVHNKDAQPDDQGKLAYLVHLDGRRLCFLAFYFADAA